VVKKSKKNKIEKESAPSDGQMSPQTFGASYSSTGPSDGRI